MNNKTTLYISVSISFSVRLIFGSYSHIKQYIIIYEC